MNALRRRVENAERTMLSAGRLIVVRANDDREAEAVLAGAGIRRGPSDTLIKIRRRLADVPHVSSIHPEGIDQLFASIDGRSVPLVRERA